MKKNHRLFLSTAAVALLLAVFLGLYAVTRPETAAGSKAFTVEVVHKDQASKTFSYRTDAEYLGEVLLAEGLIKGEMGPYGLYITEVDGEQAIYEVDQSYWAFYEGEEYASAGVDMTPVVDGGEYSLVYTVG